MKTSQKKPAIFTPEKLDGPMMISTEWSKKETEDFANYVASKKKMSKTKIPKTLHQKLPV